MKKLLLVIGLFISLVFSLLPLFWIGVVSFSTDLRFLTGEKFQFTLKNYKDLFVVKDFHFLDYLINSIVVSSLSALLAIFCSTLLAYALSRISPVLAFPLLMLSLAVSLFPQISTVGFLYSFFSQLNLINTYTALVLPYTAWSLPLGIWLMYAYMTSIPHEIDKAALIDGASRLQILIRIIIPLSKPGIITTYILLFLFCFNEFLFALIFTTDYRARTVPVGIALFEGLYGQIPWGHISAASLISVLPVILTVLMLQNHIVKGLTGGAVKG